MNNHLTTGKSYKIEDLLMDISFNNVLLVIVSIKPRNSATGFLEEINIWIKKLWIKVLSEFTDVIGCRVLWDSIVFVFDANKTEEIECFFQEILNELHSMELKSIFVSRLALNNVSQILFELNEMQEETASELDVGKLGNIHTRIIDGVKYMTEAV